MPKKIINCVSLPDATISSMPIYYFAKANVELANKEMAHYYSCCGKSICKGCVYSFTQSGNIGKCPFCNADQASKTNEEVVEELMKRVAAYDAFSICMLADSHYYGLIGFQQDRAKAIERYTRAADLGCIKAHDQLGGIYDEGGDMKKAKFHYEAAAMAGDDMARNTLGTMDAKAGNMERAIEHWTIVASAGSYMAMHHLILCFEHGRVTNESIDSILAAYNSACVEMRSKARDAYIQYTIETI